MRKLDYTLDELHENDFINNDGITFLEPNGKAVLVLANIGGWHLEGIVEGFDINEVLTSLDLDRWDSDYFRVANILEGCVPPVCNKEKEQVQKVSKQENELFSLKLGGMSYISFLLEGKEVFNSDAIKLIEYGDYWLFVSKEKLHYENDLFIDGQVISKDIIKVQSIGVCFVLTYKGYCSKAWTNIYKEIVSSSKGEYRMYGSGNDVDIERYTKIEKRVLWESK